MRAVSEISKEASDAAEMLRLNLYPQIVLTGQFLRIAAESHQSAIDQANAILKAENARLVEQSNDLMDERQRLKDWLRERDEMTASLRSALAEREKEVKREQRQREGGAGMKVELQFMVVPELLASMAFVRDPVRVKIVDPEAIFLTGLLGESGRKLVAAGVEFYFTKPLAQKLIDKGIAELVAHQPGRPQTGGG